MIPPFSARRRIPFMPVGKQKRSPSRMGQTP
nr:MAG TPA: hypothetical protein [Caudoviricetes sp.]DAM07795.1 MAG TPA: hypothetical protein [Caudoviricetes sp.]DAN76478.1 MAG TPA: hypothetical protein [Caudoviricetes sp.]DAP63686.1 MAG TPA: hypothetical protein [Caudoviricetes sp.]